MEAPMLLLPGQVSYLDGPRPGSGGVYDVSIGWTAEWEHGDVDSSRLLTVDEPRSR
jgi:hypothetical protein